MTVGLCFEGCKEIYRSFGVGSGRKVKGAQQVTVTLDGAARTMVDIYQSASVFTTQNDGSYTDVIGAKCGGSYTYLQTPMVPHRMT